MSTTAPETTPTPGVPTEGAPAPEGAKQVDTKTDDGKGIEGQPEWVQKELRAARDDAAKYRTQLREEQGKGQSQAELLAKVAEALGLATDGKADPEKLASDLESARTSQRTTQVELAVYRVAGRTGGNPDALLDSRSFMRSVDGLDPASKTFAEDVEAAVKTAIEANASLKAEKPKVPAGPSGTANSGGPGGAERKAADLDEAIAFELARQVAQKQ